MKNGILVVVAFLFLASCGPKRMSCYGKRCVEVSGKGIPKENGNVTADKKA